METRHAEICFRRAARPAHEQLKRDRQRVSEVRTRRVLAYFEEHLFAPNFTVRGAFQELGIRDNNISSTFRTKVGEPPRTYISRLRFETAARMLCDAKVPIWRIAEKIGYETIGGFSKAFQGYSRVGPERFREIAYAVFDLGDQGDIDQQQVDDLIGHELSADARRTLLLWASETSPNHRVLLLADQLARPAVQPEKTDQQQINIPVDLLTDATARELLAVRHLWQELQDLPFKKQIILVRERAHFKSPALFLHLREASRIATRDDRKKGLELARLALISVRILELVNFEQTTSQYRTLAWSWIGNVHRLSLQFDQADQAFTHAERWMPPDCLPVVKGDLCFLKAELRWYQRQFDQALELAGQAIEHFSANDLFRLRCEAIIFRAMVLFCLDRAKESIFDLRQALNLLNPVNSPMQCLSAHHQLTRCFLDIDEQASAEWHLREAKKLNRRMKSQYYDATLNWLEGLALLSAQDFSQAQLQMMQARHQYTEIKRPEHAAVLALDLAVVFSRQGELDKAALIMTDAIPVLQRLDLVDEKAIRRAMKIVREAVDGTKLTSEKVEQLRDTLQLILRTHPAFLLDQPVKS